MTIDKQLNNKEYYKSLTEGNESQHPIQVLGNLYMEEQKLEMSNLSYIRYSQGEVYFHNRDFEAAIFKWENISNELEPWAKKNMADAYFELELYSTAEDIYQLIQTDSELLKIEVLLQLFSLYVKQGKLELAVEAIKNAVTLNPDYENVTEIARAFFEEYKDWSNAIELALNESIRTSEPFWFDILHSYVEDGRTKKMEPNHFNEVLNTVFKVDLVRFEQLTVSLWHSYKSNERYFSWLNELNHILLNKEGGSAHTWRDLSILYQDTYLELTNGKYLLKEISHLIPNHLANWLKMVEPDKALCAAAATLAWSEVFGSGIEPETINKAEVRLKQSQMYRNRLEDGYELFENIMNWAKKNGVELGARFGWMVKELLDLNAHHLLLAGTAEKEKTDFIYSMVRGIRIEDTSSKAFMFKNHESEEIFEISDEGIREIADCNESQTESQTIIQWKQPIPILRDNRLALIDTPSLMDLNKYRNDVFQYLQFADSLLFILDSKAEFSEKELEIVVKIREKAPELPIYLLLNSHDQEVIEQVQSRVHTYFPRMKVFVNSGMDKNLVNNLAEMKGNRNLEEERISKVHHYIRKTIKYLLERRVEKENRFIETIKWNEEIGTKLNGAKHQLNDLEEEKARFMKRTFRKMEEKATQEMMEEIPTLLSACSELITEESDLGNIHIKLNDEMNKRIKNYIEDKALPSVHHAFKNWIAEANEELMQSQIFLNEMGTSFNELYGHEKLKLECDFKLLDDWRRDADRMTRGSIQLEKLNILLRFSPSQFLLKSAGKLFSVLPQNKVMIHPKYKQFIESEDYSEVAATISKQVLQPFELFEKALDRDINLFFKNPSAIISDAIEEAGNKIEENKDALREMRTNPESYRDPLTLFQLQLRQYEWMEKAGEPIAQIQ